jgi:hypothetical protein
MPDPFERCDETVPAIDTTPVVDCEIPEPPEPITQCPEVVLQVPPPPLDITIPCPIMTLNPTVTILPAGEAPTFTGDVIPVETEEGCTIGIDLDFGFPQFPNIPCPTLTTETTLIPLAANAEPTLAATVDSTFDEEEGCQITLGIDLGLPIQVCPTINPTATVEIVASDAEPELTVETTSELTEEGCQLALDLLLKLPAFPNIPCPVINPTATVELLDPEEDPTIEFTAEVEPGEEPEDPCQIALALTLGIPDVSTPPCPLLAVTTAATLLPAGSPPLFSAVVIPEETEDGCLLTLALDLAIPSPTTTVPGAPQPQAVFPVITQDYLSCNSPAYGMTLSDVVRPNGVILPAGSLVLIQGEGVAGFVPTGSEIRVTWPSENSGLEAASLNVVSMGEGMFFARAKLRSDLTNGAVVAADLEGYEEPSNLIFVRSLGPAAAEDQIIDIAWESALCDWVYQPRPMQVVLLTALKGQCSPATARIGASLEITVSEEKTETYYFPGEKIVVDYIDGAYHPIHPGHSTLPAKVFDPAEADQDTSVVFEQFEDHEENAANRSGESVEEDDYVFVHWNKDECVFDILPAGRGSSSKLCWLLDDLTRGQIKTANPARLVKSGGGTTVTIVKDETRTIEVTASDFLPSGLKLSKDQYLRYTVVNGINLVDMSERCFVTT